MKQIMQFLLESESPALKKGNISVYMILMTIIHFGINVEPTLQLSTVKLILMSRIIVKNKEFANTWISDLILG